MKTLKKSVALVLAIVFCFIAASCTSIEKTTVKEDGSVSSYIKIDVSEPELKKLEVLMSSYGADLGDTGLDGVSPEIAAILQAGSWEEVFNNFKNESVKEDREGVVWYVFETTTEYDSTDAFAKNYFDPNFGKLTTTDFWHFGSDLAFDNSMAAMLLLFDIECKVEETLTMPHKITRTNGTLVDDYTVKLANSTYFYIVTEASTADWTKAVKIENAIKNMVKENLKPAKVTGVKVTYDNKNRVKITWDKQKKLAEGGYDLTEYNVYRRESGSKKWKSIDWVWGGKPISYDYSFKPGKTYYYRVRASVDADEFYVHGDYSKEKSIKTADLKNKPKLKVVAGNDSATIKVTNKSTNLSGYEVSYSLRKDMKKATVKTYKKLPQTVKKLQDGKKYFFKARKYVVSDGKKVYSPYSKVQKVTVK
ncbi:MAG: fibronectin type III domain-containing protein [Clostridia bacterium]|nr:fibronectin type III domain-containing protein [Clostridia bacterium]